MPSLDVEKGPARASNIAVKSSPQFKQPNTDEISASQRLIQEKQPLNSLSGTGYNLVKTTIGCGMIFLPKAMNHCGLILGLVLIVFCAAVTFVPQLLLSQMSTLGVSDYISLSSRCYGKSVETSIVILQLLLLFTPMIAYIKLNGIFAYNFIMSLGVSSHSIFVNPTIITVILSFFVILPLCLLKNLSKLSFVSVMGLICVTYLSLLTIFDYFYDSWINGGLVGIYPGLGLVSSNISYFKFSLALMSAFNTFMLAYINHPSILPLISEMESPTASRRSKLLFRSQFVIVTFYILTTTFGYLHFGSACEDSISYILLKQNPFYLLAQILVVLVNIVTFPLIHWPARLSLDWLIREVIKSIDNRRLAFKKISAAPPSSLGSTNFPRGKIDLLEEKFDNAKNQRHTIEAGILVFISCMCAILFPSVLAVFDFFVPISGSSILFTIPALCSLKCMEKGLIDEKPMRKVLAYVCLATGILHLIIGSVSAVCTYIIKI
ncbi:hypothetical protein MDAP_002218 [Mitosporidium daphniae]|uniref:Amino acid transporter transmembrane domain-containing protein n=1 Tax=Mitosporidium daphniae TaxID=1485682 RepID=A0A098VPH8_9MICR|nr:uncharacterized protein DI09_4p400 [Mitosporidium daphniae]KGG50957.1 hypothetical protein DI09_4p400 [Mitosporidium daphniae]|eukprot:XP_013237384.1 uncharacterized protein DI09_4p400 [Mitosporidium daphniae]